MARKSNGWVKIHSNILKEGLSPAQFKFFVGSILLADPRSSKTPGVVDLSIRQLAKELGMSRSDVWRQEKELLDRGIITMNGDGFYINKYEHYQGSGKSVPPVGQIEAKKHTNTVPPVGQIEKIEISQSVPPVGQSVPTFVPAGPYKKRRSKEVKKYSNTVKKKPPLKKDKYGEAQNVLLNEEEYQKLLHKFGITEALEKIDSLSCYMGSKGIKYKSHYLTILSWDKKDKKEASNGADKKHSGPGAIPQKYTKLGGG
ncbi:MAG: winged helix-turn-helix domain-containing protein [Dehalococcoidia bacterium]|nr:winged helix-turn-helix domain-containing protein [Dehalococcoidia bacterium]MDZ4245894.1 winged helix-turn-helix domain-containing protein [Dehalococcoidia bacterium]